MKKVASLASLSFIILCVFAVSLATAQVTSENDKQPTQYIIPSVQDTISISKTGYFVAEVLDLRANKTNNGSITINGNKLPLVFKDSLPIYLTTFLRPQDVSNGTKGNPLAIQIEKMKCFASTNGKIDDAQLYLKVYFYDINKGIVVHVFERNIPYKRKSNPAFIPNLIYTAFKAAVAGLKNSKQAVVNYAPDENWQQNPKTNFDNRREEKKLDKKKVESFHTIKLPDSKIKWANPTFSLSSVKDIRPYKENEGNVLLGFFSQSSEAKLDSSMEYYFQNSIEMDSTPNKIPLTLYVNTFYFIEEETAAGEKGSLILSALLVKDSAGTPITVYKNTISIDSTNEFDITKHWPSIVSKAIGRFFEVFDLQKSNLFSISKASSPIVISNNTEMSQIVIKDYYNKKHYFKNGVRLKKISEFNESFESLYQPEIYKVYNRAKVFTRTGRICYVVAAALLANSSIDYLYSEEKSLKKWYNDPESKFLFHKKTEVIGGVAGLISGVICTTIGKSELLRAIKLHNKAIAEKVSLHISPDFFNQGFSFQLGYLLSQK